MSKIYDFDTPIPRQDSHCIKYDALPQLFGRDDLIPLWVADMDFATPDFVVDALRQRLDHPIFGYTSAYDSYWESIEQWLSRQHGWRVEREWLRYIPGIVKGIGMVINAFTSVGDKVIIQPPVYHPFRLVPQHNQREVVFNPLRRTADGSYEMDFDHLESIIDERCRLLILSNPHNPAGIVWPRETLVRLADIACRHNLIVISDEIHCDMTLYGHHHTPFATVSDAARKCSITFGAPSKTFNIAGIVSSYAIVPDADLREKFYAWLSANEMDMPTIFAMVATEAAFNKGDDWRRQMLSYVEGNIDFIDSYLRQNISAVKLLKPQASFLVWLDFSALHLPHKELVDLIVDKAHLAMNEGSMFGREGEQFMRMNVATQRSLLRQALEQLQQAVDSL